MSKNLRRFYRISSQAALILILFSILVKAIIWPSAVKEPSHKDQKEHRIAINRGLDVSKHRYTTELKGKFFDKADYLLAPAFITLFVVIAVKLINASEIFKEED